VPYTALSLKQPWAALLAAGRKSIEVRAWATRLRGPVLIHAARVPDPRPEAWALVPPELRSDAALVGGLVGQGVLLDCKSYRSAATFADDQTHHLNDLRWFRSGLFGFVFGELRPLPFVRLSGWMRFFEVPDEVLRPS
jgi:hypothetical protein